MPLTEAQKRKIEEEENYRSQLATYKQSEQIKSSQKHGVPALLSFFIPGLGQIVKGQVGKGILIFIGVGLGLLLIIPGIIIWIWQIIDAYNN
jgi:TM2 domain-containing membrane protein YozV